MSKRIEAILILYVFKNVMLCLGNWNLDIQNQLKFFCKSASIKLFQIL